MLQPQERQIIDLKYKSARIGSMGTDELKMSATALLIKICLITGWKIPDPPITKEEPDLPLLFKQQFEYKLQEDYSNMNTDEIEHAFRGTMIKDWGKHLNLKLIDEVLLPYLVKRRDLSQLEEMKEKPKELSAPQDKMSDEDFLELNRNIYSGSKIYGLVSPKCYDILVRQGKLILTEEQKEIIKVKARSFFFSIENKEYVGVLTHEEIDRYIQQNCKRLAVIEYWKL